MDASGAAVWAGLSETQMVDTNAGLETGLVGSRATIASALDALEAAGVDIVMCQFEDVTTDVQGFRRFVLRSSSVQVGLRELEDQH